MGKYIALDIGGTQMRIAVYAAQGISPLKQTRVATRSSDSPVLERLQNLIASTWPEDDDVTAIGIIAPGPIDQEKGIIYEAPNIPGWVNLPLRQILEDRFHIPVALGNDANLAAVAEWRYGAGQGHHNLLYLTISTGIGGGAIVGDRLLLGASGLAGEFGHTVIDPEGPVCSCGKFGHLEAFASGPAIARFFAQEAARGGATSLPLTPPPTTREISSAAQQGDPLAKAALARAGYYLGLGVCSFLHLFNPSIVVLGGGVSRSGASLIDPMKETIRKNVISNVYLQDLTITQTALGDDTGLLGALALARAEHDPGLQRAVL